MIIYCSKCKKDISETRRSEDTAPLCNACRMAEEGETQLDCTICLEDITKREGATLCEACEAGIDEYGAETWKARYNLIENKADADAIDAYIALGTGDDGLNDFEEAYVSQFKSDKDFAQDMAEQLGETIPEHWPHYCIDWEYAARELMMDYSEQDGYYFRNI